MATQKCDETVVETTLRKCGNSIEDILDVRRSFARPQQKRCQSDEETMSFHHLRCGLMGCTSGWSEGFYEV